jgi:hypothetical protein
VSKWTKLIGTGFAGLSAFSTALSLLLNWLAWVRLSDRLLLGMIAAAVALVAGRLLLGGANRHRVRDLAGAGLLAVGVGGFIWAAVTQAHAGHHGRPDVPIGPLLAAYDPQQLAYIDRHLYVLGSGQLVRLDPRHPGLPADPIDLKALTADDPIVTVAGAGTMLVLVSAGGRVFIYAEPDHRPLDRRLAVGEWGGCAGAAGPVVFLCNDSHSKLDVYNTRHRRLRYPELGAPGPMPALLITADTVWVGAINRDRRSVIVGFSVAAPHGEATRSQPFGPRVKALAYGDGTLWAAFDDRNVVPLDPQTADPDGPPIKLNDFDVTVAMAWVDGALCLLSESHDQVACVDPRTHATLGRQHVLDQPKAMLYTAGRLWLVGRRGVEGITPPLGH